MALTKFNFNSFDVTTAASSGLAFNSSANGFDTASAGAMTLLTTNTISYFTVGTNVGNGSDESLSGEMYLFSPSSTTFIKHFIFVNQNSSLDGSGGNYCATQYSAGYCNVTDAIDGVDFKFAGGNIDSGIIKMYGVTK